MELLPDFEPQKTAKLLTCINLFIYTKIPEKILLLYKLVYLTIKKYTCRHYFFFPLL
jgi:hypothetical protein